MKQECAAPFAKQNLNGAGQSQFPKETADAAPEHLLFRGVRKRIRSAQPLLRSKIKNGAGQSQFPKETVTCLHWYGGCSMIVENEQSVRQLERRQRFEMK